MEICFSISSIFPHLNQSSLSSDLYIVVAILFDILTQPDVDCLSKAISIWVAVVNDLFDVVISWIY